MSDLVSIEIDLAEPEREADRVRWGHMLARGRPAAATEGHAGRARHDAARTLRVWSDIVEGRAEEPTTRVEPTPAT